MDRHAVDDTVPGSISKPSAVWWAIEVRLTGEVTQRTTLLPAA
jgi:hypothetical protein